MAEAIIPQIRPATIWLWLVQVPDRWEISRMARLPMIQATGPSSPQNTRLRIPRTMTVVPLGCCQVAHPPRAVSPYPGYGAYGGIPEVGLGTSAGIGPGPHEGGGGGGGGVDTTRAYA